MMKFFNNLKISKKLLAIGIIGATVLLFCVFLDSWQFYKIMMEDRQNKIMNITETAMGIVKRSYDEEKSGRLTHEQAQKLAFESIRVMRFNKTDYIWINDMECKMLMHPAKPELEGKDLSGFADPTGRKIFYVWTQQVKTEKAFFDDYLWPKPGFDEPVKKISYIQNFEPWGWVLGSGIYVDEVNALVLNMILGQFGIALLGFSIVFAGTILISRKITTPLKLAKDTIDSIIQERFDITLPQISSTDEVGQILEATHNLYYTSVNAIRIKTSLETVDSSIMILDNQNQIIYSNPALQKLFQNYNDEIQKFIPGFSSKTLTQNSIDILLPYFESKDIISDKSLTTSCKFNDCNLRVHINPIFNAHKQRLGTVLSWDDIIHELKIQKEIEDLLQKALAGDLNYRLSLEGKKGFMELLCKNMNQFLDVVGKAITEVATVLSKISKGDLSARVEGNYLGVFGTLQKSTNDTSEHLHKTITSLIATGKSIHNIAEEVSNHSEDLSSRTEHQASSLQETAASMEQIASTIQQNSNNANQAKELAIQSKKIAENGGEVAQESIQAMELIQESSKKVFGVIDVINEIAFQTNLLALNASVEAARAGDNGRGFAVVAAEVRSLAQRCANAAKEIQSLISESDQQIHEGVKLTSQTGESFNKILLSTQNLSKLISEIALASVEQSTGVSQINIAVSKMDETTQQNAALVHQELGTVEELKKQAQEMSNMINVFQLN